MARIRTIKPEFWRNENLSTISPEAALLAIGLLNHSDDDGYFNANEKIIKADIFPLRDLSRSTTVLLQELNDIGYVELFYDDENNCKSRIYGKVVNFTLHQVINKPNKSKIKHLKLLPYDYGSTTVALPHGKGKGKGKGMEQGTGNGKENTENKIFDDVVFDVFTYWQIKTQNQQSKFTVSREKLIKKMLTLKPEPYTPIQLKLAIDGHSKSDFHKTNGRMDIQYSFRETNIDKFIKMAGMTDAELKRTTGKLNWDDTSWADGLQAEFGVRN